MSDLRIRLGHNLGPLLALALFLVFYLIYNANHPRGFSGQILVQNANESFVLVMVAMAQTLPALIGGLDLSVGAVMTMVNTLASHLMVGSPLQVLGGVVICLLVGMLAGFINGCIVVYGRIQPIIATLASGAVYMGIALFLRPTPGGKIDGDLSWALTNDIYELAATYGFADSGEAAWLQPIAWIPLPIIFLVLIVLFIWLPFRRSVTGRGLYAVGSAEGAAYMSGVRVDRSKIAAFTVAGLFAALAGIYLTLQTSSGNADVPQAGAYTLNSIAAVVIGGTSLLGGVGSAIGSIFGALVIRSISFNFRIFSVDPLLQPLIEGAVLLAAVSIGAARVFQVKNKLKLSQMSAATSAARGGKTGSAFSNPDNRPILIASACIVVILLIGTVYTLYTQGTASFLQPRYLLQQLQIGAFLGLVAAGMMLVILMGHIDLSVPWTIAAAAMMATAVGGPLALPVGIGIGLAVGLVNGLGAAFLRVPSMIFTLGVNAVLRGLMVMHTGGFAPQTHSTPLMEFLAVGHIFGIPMALVVWIGVSILFVIMLQKTPLGRYIYAVGNREAAAYLSGVNTRLVLVASFMLCSTCAALAGVLLAGYSTKAYQGMGDAYLLPAIAAVVIGGTNILGGQGRYLGTVVGTILIVLLTSVLSIMQMPEAGRQIIYGLVIILMLLAYGRRDRVTS